MGHSSDSDSSHGHKKHLRHGHGHHHHGHGRHSPLDLSHHNPLDLGHHNHRHGGHHDGLISGVGGLLGGHQGSSHHGHHYAPPPGHHHHHGHDYAGGHSFYPHHQPYDHGYGHEHGHRHEHEHEHEHGYGRWFGNERGLGDMGSLVHQRGLDPVRRYPASPAPGYNFQRTPPPSSGHRIALDTSSAAFPSPAEAGTPPCYEADGAPVYLGSALFERSVFPCRIEVRYGSPAKLFVAYGGHEHPHYGRYDLLPFVPEQMEFVPTSHGHIPHGRRPIDGGYEENGHKLYHAVAIVHGVRVPGKTGEHLGCCYVGHGGSEHAVDNYEILCWR